MSKAPTTETAAPSTAEHIMARELASARSWDALLAGIRDWCDNHMDQWERFRLPGKHGPIYVSIRLQPDAPESAYDEVEL